LCSIDILPTDDGSRHCASEWCKSICDHRLQKIGDGFHIDRDQKVIPGLLASGFGDFGLA
jgi:hypothetical protein